MEPGIVAQLGVEGRDEHGALAAEDGVAVDLGQHFDVGPGALDERRPDEHGPERLLRVGDGVEVLATIDGHPVLCRQGAVLVAAFHPELGDDARLHELFLDLVGK